jgi:hypothetical protein
MDSKITLLIFCLLFFFQSSFSQIDSASSVSDVFSPYGIPNSFGLTFDNTNNTYRWDGNLNYQKNFNKINVQLNEQYKSSLIQTSKKLVRDEQNFELLTHYKISPSLRASSRVYSLIVSDNQSEGLGRVSSHSILGGFEYKPMNEITLESLIGERFDKQVDQEDHGLSYLIDARADNLDISGFKTYFLGYFEGNYLKPRKLETHNINLSLQKYFFQNTRNAISLTYKKNLKEFYFIAEPAIRSEYNIINNIERRNENIFSVYDTLDYNIGNGIQISINGTASLREIDRSIRYKPTATDGNDSRYLGSHIHDFKIEGTTELKYEPSKYLNSRIQLIYGERDVAHNLFEDVNLSTFLFESKKRDEEKKNNNSQRTTLAGTLNFILSDYHKISLSGSSSILRYDTPSNSNDDDRDELWMAYNLTTYHTINRYFSAEIPINAYLTHIVYLYKTRSANNNWNRVFRLAPRLQFNPHSVFSTTNTFEVLANYTAYDFEGQLVSVNSFSFRQFAFIDSSSLNLSKKITLDWYNNIRLYERGELNWKSFKGRPINYFEDKTYIGQLRYSPKQNLLFSVGIRYFSQSSFKYEGRSKNLETFLRSIGPIGSIVWTTESVAELIVKGFYEKIDFTGTKTHNSTNLFMNIKIFL